MHIPQIFPRLPFFPKKDLSFDQPAISVKSAYLPHLFIRQWIAGNSKKIAEYISRIRGKWNGCLPALHCPLETDHGGMNSMTLGDA
jgi:hypothetical protein